MNKNTAIALLAGLLIGQMGGQMTLAQSPTIVLTPTALYDLIEKQQIKTNKLTHVCLRQNQRIQKLETTLAKVTAALSKRIAKLEGN